MKDKRMMVVLSILILVIGFASVTTTLVLNGTLTIGEAKDDFKIIFTEARLDGIKKNRLISEDKKTITFETKELSALEDKSTLEYTVSNTSRQYDANIEVSCYINENDEVNSNPNIDITYEPKNMVVSAGESKSGTIEVKLIKVVTTPEDVNLKCELVATPVERDTLGDEYVPGKEPFSEAGTLMSVEYYDWTVPLTGAIWRYHDWIKRLVFEDEINPHETLDDFIFDVSEQQDGSVMAYLVKIDDSYYDAYIQSETGVKAPSNCMSLFQAFSALETIEGLEYFDTSKASNMSYMFSLCKSLKEIDLNHFNTSNVTNMNSMFYGCDSLISINLNSFNTEKVTDIGWMFYNCGNLENANLSSFDIPNIENTMHLFGWCQKLKRVDMSSMNFTTITRQEAMFLKMPDDAKIIVKDEAAQQWILTGDNSHPTAWTTENVIIKAQ